MLKRSKKILLEGTLAEFKNYPRGAEGREYVLMNIEEKGPDGSYAFYEKDEKGDIIPVSYIGTEGYDATEFILFEDPEVERIVIENFDSNNSGRITRKELSKVKDIGTLLTDGNENITSLNDLLYFSSITNLKLSETGSGATGLPNLVSITVPAKVTSLLFLVTLSIFPGDTKLQYINVSKGNKKYDSRNNCNAIINKLDDSLILGCNNTTIPESVKSIGERAFCLSKNIESITIPSNIQSIKDEAFYTCGSLTSVSIEDGINSIGRGAFLDCFNLSSINLPSSLNILTREAFKNCTSLLSIEIPGSIQVINDHTFEGCTNLSSVIINEGTTTIKGGAFKNCPITVLHIPSTIISISSNFSENGYGQLDTPFYGCYSLLQITVDENNPVYDSRNNCNALIKTETNELLQGCSNTIIPADITRIAERAFYKTNIQEVINSNITYIEKSAFQDCINLTTVNCPNLTQIGNSAFSGTSISNINISGIQAIDNYIFENCKNLQSVEVSNDLLSIGNGSFRGCTQLDSFLIPNKVSTIGLEAFKNTGLLSITIPSSVTSIGNSAFIGCPLTSIVIDNANSNYDSRNNCNAIILKSNNTLIQGCSNTVIPDTVVKISSSSFNYCKGLTSITIPASVTSIEDGAFKWCNSLSTITVDSNNAVYDSRDNCNAIITKSDNSLLIGCKNTIIPNTVTSILSNAFQGSGITSITIPSSVTIIKLYCFADCINLTSVEIPESITTIGYNAFNGCESLTSIMIPSSVTYIGSNAFTGCSSLTSIAVDEGNTYYDSRNDCNAIIYTLTNTLIQGCKNTVIPNSVTKIGEASFRDCTSLTSIVIPEGVTVIGDSAFYRCSNLTSIEIPSSVTEIGQGAFSGCTGLTSITCESETPVSLPNTYVFSNVDKSACTLYVPFGSKSAYESALYWNEFLNIVEI